MKDQENVAMEKIRKKSRATLTLAPRGRHGPRCPLAVKRVATDNSYSKGINYKL